MRTYEHLEKARRLAVAAKKQARLEKFQRLTIGCEATLRGAKHVDTMKIALAMLYLGEGSKSRKKSIVTFANADPKVIRLFLRMLRACFPIDEAKFRCTLQCRADQDAAALQAFWSEQTGIPLTLFYKPSMDPRTIGKPTKRVGYKGVLRVDYFSSMLFNELLLIAELLCEGR